MILIVGLGNPGEQFSNTRHNIGREIATLFAKKASFPEFHFEKKWKSWISEGKIEKTKIAVILPDTFMNNTGKAVKPIALLYKIKPKDVYLIHDDADLPLGNAKLSFNKNSAGHKGVESVIRSIGTKELWRFRVGIAGKKNIPAEKIVIRPWASEETRLVKKMMTKTVDALLYAISEVPEKTMNAYNT